MRPSNPRVMLPLVVLSLLAALPAQEQTGPTPVRADALAPRVSVQFPGGTLKDFVQAIRAVAADVNIVLPDRADKVPVPPITLRNALVMNALEAAAVVQDRDEYQMQVKAFAAGREQAPVYAIRIEAPRSTSPVGPAGGASNTRVLSLRTITEAPPALPADPSLVMSAETVLTAVKAGLTVASLAPVLKYHAESGLLFVQGPVTAGELVATILRQIESDVTARRNETQRALAQKAASAAAEGARKATEGK